MRAVVQRVKKASVSVENRLISNINRGLLVFIGVEKNDSDKDINYIASKLIGLRIFENDEGKMNLDVKEISGEILLVSQFTLAGDVRKGRRPSFQTAEEPEKASSIFNNVVDKIIDGGVNTKTGKFQAHMEVELVNDGPVTILLDSKKGF